MGVVPADCKLNSLPVSLKFICPSIEPSRLNPPPSLVCLNDEPATPDGAVLVPLKIVSALFIKLLAWAELPAIELKPVKRAEPKFAFVVYIVLIKLTASFAVMSPISTNVFIMFVALSFVI